MHVFSLCVVFYRFPCNWQLHLIQLVSKLNDFQNRHSAVLFMKVITLYKVPLLKICFILQKNIFFWNPYSLPTCCASLQNPKLSWKQAKSKFVFSSVQNLSSKSFKDFSGNIVHSSFLLPLQISDQFIYWS